MTFKARTVKFIIISKSVKVMTCCEGTKTIYGENQIRIKNWAVLTQRKQQDAHLSSSQIGTVHMTRNANTSFLSYLTFKKEVVVMNRYFGLTKHRVVRDNYIILRKIKHNSLYYLVNSLL